MQQRDDEDGDAEIADQLVEEVEREEHRLGQEIEPAPIDQQVEFGDGVFLAVAVEEIDLLGAGKHLALGLAVSPGRDRDGVHQIVGSGKPVAAIGLRSEKLASNALPCSGMTTAAQYLSVMPSQPCWLLKLVGGLPSAFL